VHRWRCAVEENKAFYMPKHCSKKRLEIEENKEDFENGVNEYSSTYLTFIYCHDTHTVYYRIACAF
jgi:hypothetical protein